MLEIVDGKAHIHLVRELILEYVHQLNRDLTFQSIDEELRDPSAKYTAPQGEVLIAMEDQTPLGMVAYHRHSDVRCEMKRLYVKSEARGLRLGDRLVREILAHARASGYREIVLDTLAYMKPAIHLYHKYGFEECAPYYHNPMADVIYMRKQL